jgi:hypothetical protein
MPPGKAFGSAQSQPNATDNRVQHPLTYIAEWRTKWLITKRGRVLTTSGSHPPAVDVWPTDPSWVHAAEGFRSLAWDVIGKVVVNTHSSDARWSLSHLRQMLPDRRLVGCRGLSAEGSF